MSATTDIDRSAMYDRILASDPAWDGRFYFGVVTTGVYCKPSCRVRKPRLENVRFYRSPAEARAAGLRPCRRCHPDDLASPAELVRDEVLSLVAEIRANPAEFPGVEAVVARSGYGSSRLFGMFRRALGVTPGTVLNQARIEHARRLLKQSDVGVLDVALASGFRSLSVFHRQFKQTTGTTPTAYRATSDAGRDATAPAATGGSRARPEEGANQMDAYDSFETPLGRFTIVVRDDGAVVASAFAEIEELSHLLGGRQAAFDPARVAEARAQVEEYFAGTRTQFDLPLAEPGSDFGRRYRAEMATLGYGSTTTYGELARRLGSSARAAGRANATNPLCIIVPCHRVIGAGGSLTGYAYGVDIKRRLLELEGVSVQAPLPVLAGS